MCKGEGRHWRSVLEQPVERGWPEQVEGLVLARRGKFTFSNRTEVETRALTQKWAGTGAMWGPKLMPISSVFIFSVK